MERKRFISLLGYGALGMGMAPAAYAGINSKKSDYETCKSVWGDLCGAIGTVYKTDAFEYVHPVRKTPNVLLYGDSISIGYTPAVRKSLEEKATVFRLYKNGGSSQQFIPNMDKMNATMFQPYLRKGWNFKWDLIHFNVGLHDLKYLSGKHLDKNGEQVSSIGVYKENLDKICKYLKSNYPEAKLVFATTTPVPENAKGRYSGDSIKFNTAAREVLEQYPEIEINDLYAFTLPQRKAWAQEPGNVHYNELGSTEQGKEVARIIAENL
ncbi:SGNH/GDSL hydrolase family protein [Maribacter polysaccharolyticus]|uniref:SGNH/GDSL hydrolase family protein n=1 Tax=Maribacter polysaccharolyticus TaxID=3020831 RepID=UPI00237F3E9B|nr:SGNH/GDSL hydrolase family protein [Maribacter polysaccharolyticus]MDE3740950.1 SGNH/GDSL hydrolase family protein [Maribacter polysaccharolyticus]